MRSRVRFRWRPRVFGMLTAALLSCSLTLAPADEPATDLSQNQVFQSVEPLNIERLATAEQVPYSANSAAEAPMSPPAYPSSPPPAAKPSPPPQPWKPVFFDNDFRYKKTTNHPYFLGEELKDLPVPFDFLPCNSTLSYGGEVRHRFMDESNRLRPGGPGQSDYNLWRWRQYVDFRAGDDFRVYVEMIDASMFGLDAPYAPQGIDVNRWDLQNAFIDVNVLDLNDKPIYLRVGRQELLYGAQRSVSPLDWSNMRRNFEGLKLFTKQGDWDLDAWITRPLDSANTNVGPVARNDHKFDEADFDRLFGGVYATYKGIKNHTVDLYWLYDKQERSFAGFPQGERYTLATRWLGNFPVEDWGVTSRTYHGEVEGGYQFGHDRGQAVQAGFLTAGVGHTWNKIPWEPNFWFYYDWASGDHNPTDTVNSTYFQHYGLAHAYLGLIDNIARQNISDLNCRATVKPLKQIDFQAAYHWFDLDTPNDKLYNVTGAPIPAGASLKGTKVGEEMDLLGTYTFNPNFNVQLGYFRFWNGTYIKNNAPRSTADMFYVQSTVRY